MFHQKRKFKNSKGLTLSAIYEGKNEDAPVVVMCHGFWSTKDGSAQNLSKLLLDKGLSVYRFDFTGCGESEGDLSGLTPMQGLDDLKSAINNLSENKFAIYGSSFGGHTALLYASQNVPLALGLKAPVSNYPETIARSKRPEEQRPALFVEELKKIDLYELSKKITCPVIIFHGDKDDIVAISQSEKLLDVLPGDKKLVAINGANHHITGDDLQDVNKQLAEFFVGKLL